MSTLLILAEAYGVSVNRIVEGLPTPKERKPPPPGKGIARVDRARGTTRAPD
jgi:hypothetical protein